MVAITSSAFTGFWRNATAPFSRAHCSATAGSRTVTTTTGMADSSRFCFSRSRTTKSSPRQTKIQENDVRTVLSGLDHGLDAVSRPDGVKVMGAYDRAEQIPTLERIIDDENSSLHSGSLRRIVRSVVTAPTQSGPLRCGLWTAAIVLPH